MKRLATYTSIVIHPIIMPLVSVFLAFKFDWYLSGRVSGEQEYMVYLIIFLSTIAFPGVNILLLKWYGVISSLSMPIREERITPFVSTLLFFGMGYYLLRKGNLPVAVYSIYLGCGIVLLLLVFVNTKWKISVHAAGIAGVLGATIALFQIHSSSNIVLLTMLILGTGLALTSRLVLSAHSPAQVYAGAFLGMITAYLTVLYEVVI